MSVLEAQAAERRARIRAEAESNALRAAAADAMSQLEGEAAAAAASLAATTAAHLQQLDSTARREVGVPQWRAAASEAPPPRSCAPGASGGGERGGGERSPLRRLLERVRQDDGEQARIKAPGKAPAGGQRAPRVADDKGSLRFKRHSL